MITDDFAPLLVATFNDPGASPVHVLFNQWWKHAPDDVKESYVAQFLADPEFRAFVEEGYYAEPPDVAAMGRMEPGTLGRSFHDWIVDNNLTEQIAMDYRQFHEFLESTGQLDGMPEAMKYAVLRGFQTHDYQHLVTGYDSSGLGEIALQAFCLAQMNFPYFGMWISVVTTRMTFLEPTSITPLMDAITDGWQLGRRSPNIQCVKWDEHLERPLSELRAEFGVEPTGLATSAGASGSAA